MYAAAMERRGEQVKHRGFSEDQTEQEISRVLLNRMDSRFDDVHACPDDMYEDHCRRGMGDPSERPLRACVRATSGRR